MLAKNPNLNPILVSDPSAEVSDGDDQRFVYQTNIESAQTKPDNFIPFCTLRVEIKVENIGERIGRGDTHGEKYGGKCKNGGRIAPTKCHLMMT